MANQNHIAKELKRKYIKKIASYESQMKQMQDSDFALRTEDFRPMTVGTLPKRKR